MGRWHCQDCTTPPQSYVTIFCSRPSGDCYTHSGLTLGCACSLADHPSDENGLGLCSHSLSSLLLAHPSHALSPSTSLLHSLLPTLKLTSSHCPSPFLSSLPAKLQ